VASFQEQNDLAFERIVRLRYTTLYHIGSFVKPLSLALPAKNARHQVFEQEKTL
jgi:hypothetical protein